VLGARSPTIQNRAYAHRHRHSFATDYLARGGNPVLQLRQSSVTWLSLAMVPQAYQHLTFTNAHDERMRVLAANNN
jgi:hypothetical protein